MNMKAGDFVKSLKGHDKDEYFVIIATLNEKFVLIANGTTRKVDKPKQKNIKHLRKVGEFGENSNTITDNDGIASKIDKLLQDIKTGGANV